MKTARISPLPAALVLTIACATGAGTAKLEVSTLQSWSDVMDIVGPTYEEVLVPQLDVDLERMDLPRIARTAADAAAAIALGYGRLRQPRVPTFTGHARQTERWLRQIVQAARTGQRQALRTLIPIGKVRHCDACHAAAERAGLRD